MYAPVTFDVVVYLESLVIKLFDSCATLGALCRLVCLRHSKTYIINIMHANLNRKRDKPLLAS